MSGYYFLSERMGGFEARLALISHLRTFLSYESIIFLTSRICMKKEDDDKDTKRERDNYIYA